MANKIYCIWNHSYKALHVFAEDAMEALRFAKTSGHIRGRHRKWEDCTSTMILGDDDGHLARALASNVKGVGSYVENEGWEISGQKV